MCCQATPQQPASKLLSHGACGLEENCKEFAFAGVLVERNMDSYLHYSWDALPSWSSCTLSNPSSCGQQGAPPPLLSPARLRTHPPPPPPPWSGGRQYFKSEGRLGCGAAGRSLFRWVSLRKFSWTTPTWQSCCSGCDAPGDRWSRRWVANHVMHSKFSATMIPASLRLVSMNCKVYLVRM